MATKKKGLGSKGLGIEALINNKMEDFKEVSMRQQAAEAVNELDIDMIEPNRKQPRKHFDAAALEELAESLKIYGMIQPVVVKKNADYYELIAGERRWRAAKIAGLQKIPVIIRDWAEGEAFEAALVENLQREDLNPIEESESYQRLQEEFGLSQEKIAERVGKSRSAIANSLRLLQLDPRVRNFVTENKLSGGHARTLLGIQDGDAQFELAEQVLEDGLSVRALEALVKKEQKKNSMETTAPKPAEDEDKLFYHEIEETLKTVFATKVKLSRKKNNKGKIEIEYYSKDDLERLLTMMTKRMEHEN